MNRVKIEFEKRVLEIEQYFEYIAILDNGKCSINGKTIDGASFEKEINDDLVKILRANGFILLYNLVEATITKSIEALFATIYEREVTFKNLSDNLKKLWIIQKSLPLNKGIDAIGSNKIIEIITKVVNDIIENEITKLEIDCVKISGNVDAKKIRDIADKIGFERPSQQQGEDLVVIKDKRNKLAHGEFSFCEIGKDYSIRDMCKFKNSTINHLEEYIYKIEEYIQLNSYLSSNVIQ
ncbi:MAE_28990/MAE_18760 family HEPN-like nuclease [Bacteroides fragilis]|jgi:hypothetical protein|uniref:MAE_28990/MAE_18760 family HEPN-like nuclease n=1 Tax=Bacteroides fragilis TaxID=817 RepID=UPI00101C541C|nr:MAE_28990/MAE_18760 family HEPN-like nuclease [Bacteroides fragilis]